MPTISWETKFSGEYLLLLAGVVLLLIGFLGYVYYGGIETLSDSGLVEYWYGFIAIGALLFLGGAYWLRPAAWKHRFR